MVFWNPWASSLKVWIVFFIGLNFLFKSILAWCAYVYIVISGVAKEDNVEERKIARDLKIWPQNTIIVDTSKRFLVAQKSNFFDPRLAIQSGAKVLVL